MGYDRLRVKENARLHYANNKWNNVLVIFLFMVISSAVSGILYGIMMGLTTIPAIFIGIGTAAAEEYSELSNIGSISSAFLGMGASFISILVTGVVTGALIVGVNGWFLKSIHQTKLGIGEMFAPFKNNFFQTGLMYTLKFVVAYLGAFTLGIVTIIAQYGFMFSDYIMAEDPSIKAVDALKKSWDMTKGHKWDLAVLQLSFIGWFILSSWTCNILGFLYVFPYFYAANAFAYEEIKAEYQARNMQ